MVQVGTASATAVMDGRGIQNPIRARTVPPGFFLGPAVARGHNRRSNRPPLPMARAQAPMLSASCGRTKTTTGEMPIGRKSAPPSRPVIAIRATPWRGAKPVGAVAMPPAGAFARPEIVAD